MTAVRRRDVAIYAPHAAAFYSDGPAPPSGGAESQTYELARFLAGVGLDVCHVVFDHGSLDQSQDGIELVPLPPDLAEHHIARHTSAIVRTLERANARVYVQRTAGYETGVLAAFSRTR